MSIAAAVMRFAQQLVRDRMAVIARHYTTEFTQKFSEEQADLRRAFGEDHLDAARLENEVTHFIIGATANGVAQYSKQSFKMQATFNLELPCPAVFYLDNPTSSPLFDQRDYYGREAHAIAKNLWWSHPEAAALIVDVGRGRRNDGVTTLSTRILHTHYDYEALAEAMVRDQNALSGNRFKPVQFMEVDPYYLDGDNFVHGEEILYTSSDLKSIIFDDKIGGHAELLRDLFGLHGALDDEDYDGPSESSLIDHVDIDAFIRVRKPVDHEDVKVGDYLSHSYLPKSTTITSEGQRG